MNNSRIHFRSVFTVKKSVLVKDKNIFQILTGLSGRWLKKRYKNSYTEQFIFKPWLYKGGNLAGPNNAHAIVQTKDYDESSKSANIWIMRLEHPDTDFPSRIWRSDIAVVYKSDVDAQVAITITWEIRNDYIGIEPSIPNSSVPVLIKEIFGNDELSCFNGSKKLSLLAQKLQVGDGRNFYQFLLSKERFLPVLLINKKI